MNDSTLDIDCTINKFEYVVNGEQLILKYNPILVNGIFYLPIDFLSDLMNYDVKWDVSSKTLILSLTKSVEDVVKYKDRVVLIQNFDENGKLIEAGSGIIVSKDGLILTNQHVLTNAKNVTVTLDNQTTASVTKIIADDETNDLALIKIDKDNLPYMKLQKSLNYQLGEQVVVIGSPFVLLNTVSTGIISAVDRELEKHHFIQISVPIEHGNSGGAVLNMQGELIGVVSMGFDSSGQINFAIPSYVVSKFLGDLNY